uniref:Uncharacterized protein n=1 Tax=Rhodnius prolixus TaxID=13249 RepID=T1I2Z6_RHOPR
MDSSTTLIALILFSGIHGQLLLAKPGTRDRHCCVHMILKSVNSFGRYRSFRCVKWNCCSGLQVFSETLVDQEFTPVVTATCKAGYMTIRVHTNSSFSGAVHAKDYRTPSCLAYGNGSNTVILGINLFASSQSQDYCGVLVSNKTEERSLPVAVRIHRTLELADDKFYVITCGKAGFKNARCPLNKQVLSPFIYSEKEGHADSELYSMFQFPDGNQVHFQCDIGVCKGGCGEPSCSDDSIPTRDIADDGILLASTSVFVLQPGDIPNDDHGVDFFTEEELISPGTFM